MTFSLVLSSYLSLQLLLALAFLWLELSKPLRSKSSRDELKFHYGTLVLVLVLWLVFRFVPSQDVFEPFSKENFSIAEVSTELSYSNQSQQYFAVPSLNPKTKIEISNYPQWTFLLLLILVIFKIGRDFLVLRRLTQKSILFRKTGKVRIALNPSLTQPCSFWLGNAWVLVPQEILMHSQNLKHVIAHELQHHRQRDTMWAGILFFIKSFSILNPFVYRWFQRISEIQEFACDEAVVDRSRASSQAYARCLLEVAQSAFPLQKVPASATGFLFGLGRKNFQRRIEKMLTHQKVKRKSLRLSFLCMAGFIGIAAFATQELVQDRTITQEMAHSMLEGARSSSGFPLEVNDLVLKHLNEYLGTQAKRESFKEALTRMKTYEGMISKKIKAHGVPEEMIAIPIIESGYQNLQPKQNKLHGAGLWMFIEGTAKRFDLIKGGKDNRMVPELETEAAMELLVENHKRYNKDWLLSILAYNMGERAVDNAKKKTNSSDAWKLIRSGHENDKGYLPKLFAAILIMKNPKVLD